MNKKEFVNSVRQKYAPSVPQIDRERYTDIPGLEGPFMLRSGKVVYYDPKEGKYYDRDRDMYLGDDEYHAHSNPRAESVSFYRFCQILEGKELKEWDPNEPDERPEDHADYPMAHGSYDLTASLRFEKGVFHDTSNEKAFPPIPYPPLEAIVGGPEDTYTLESRVVVSGHYIPGNDHGGGFSRDDEFHGEPAVEIDGFTITNDRTKKSAEIPSGLVEDKIIGTTGTQRATYRVDFELNGRKIEVSVV